VPETRLTCPHCGHDGTRETATSPLKSYGFNYLQDDVVSRDVQGYDDAGKLQLSPSFKCAGAPGTNPRIECRNCWQTFPPPPDMEWVVSTEAPAGADEEPVAFEVGELRNVAERVTETLVQVLSSAVKEAQQRTAEDLRRLEATVASLAGVTEEIPSLRSELGTLRQQTDSLVEAERQLSFRMARMEARLNGLDAVSREDFRRVTEGQEQIRQALETQASAAAALDQTVRQLQENAQALQERFDRGTAETSAAAAAMRERLEALDQRLRDNIEASEALRAAWAEMEGMQNAVQRRLETQAEAIRSIHLAQEVRREELRAALQKLEDIAGGMSVPKPLPEDL